MVLVASGAEKEASLPYLGALPLGALPRLRPVLPHEVAFDLEVVVDLVGGSAEQIRRCGEAVV